MIKINIEKAKSIAHDIRRASREKEFEPLDSLIAKQLPGLPIAEIEAKRQKVREKYAEQQTAIDAAQTVDDLKSIIE